MNRSRWLFLGVVGLLVFPPQAWANAGTPLMWATASHLVIGNAFIGALEGWLLARWFQVPWGRPVALMIAANYASAWLGGVFIRGVAVDLIPMDLNNGWKWFWIMVGVTYCLTLLIEWPFMAFLLRKNPGWMKRSAGAALGVQSVSYLVVFGWYWLASGTSLYTTAQVVRPQDLSLPESVLSETPFGAWTVRNVVHLPSDKVLFELGEDQICGFDPVKRQVALLWRGRGPVPVIGKRGME